MITEQTFRTELDGYLKRIGGEFKHKKNRSLEIEDALIYDTEYRDGILEHHRKEAINAEQCRNQAAHIPLESEEQISFVTWFKENYKYPEYLIYSLPNGGVRDWKTAKTLKAEGSLPGVSDLKIERSDGLDIYLEMKRIKGSTHGEEQKKFQEFQESRGKTYLLCYGFEDAQRQINEFLKEV